MDITKLLKELSLLPAISGQEDLVRDYIVGKIKNHCDYYTDPLGNLIAEKKGKQTPLNKIMISAHMDEVGFIITDITSDGLLAFSNVGGIDNSVIFGKSVAIGKTPIYGVIGGKPIHLLKDDEKKNYADSEKLYIDIGAKTKEEAEKHIVLGEFAVFHSTFTPLGEKRLMGKAIDDRVGCAIMIDMILSECLYDTTFAFTVQEEVGCIGGATASFGVQPRFGIILEATTASDIGGVSKEDYVCTQGDGPVVSFMDKGTLYDKNLYQLTMTTAKELGIPCQPKRKVAGGNEARSVQKAGQGVGVIAVSLPVRYLHSPNNVVHIEDIENTRKLLTAIVEKLAEVKQ